jgi:hypothetical protein
VAVEIDGGPPAVGVSVLPVPALGAVRACIGAVAMLRRSSVVKIADSATERSVGVTKGSVSISASIVSSAACACALVGLCGIGGKLALRA